MEFREIGYLEPRATERESKTMTYTCKHCGAQQSILFNEEGKLMQPVSCYKAGCKGNTFKGTTLEGLKEDLTGCVLDEGIDRCVVTLMLDDKYCLVMECVTAAIYVLNVSYIYHCEAAGTTPIKNKVYSTIPLFPLLNVLAIRQYTPSNHSVTMMMLKERNYQTSL